NINQVALRLHYLVDVLVGAGYLIYHPFILATLDAVGLNRQIVQRESALRCPARHLASGSVTARCVRVRVTLAAHDETSCAHASGYDSELAVPRGNRSLTRDPKPLSEMLFERCVVVMAVHCFLYAFDLALQRLAHSGNHQGEHDLTVYRGVILRPLEAFDVFI